jgi:CRISPR/Cas system-associated exonuclease Cas4 (RecB family)
MAARKPKPLPRSVKGDSRTAKALAETMKNDSGPVGKVQRMLLANALNDNSRPTNVIHPSELCKNDWCSRRAYYRITGVEETEPGEINHRSEAMFEEGHSIHDKWQGWFWDIGLLEGMFFCHNCRNYWWDVAPTECSECGQARWGLRYREVPIKYEDMLIGGRADGILDDEMLEVKSIGPGTTRWERPELHGQYQRKEITLEQMWGAIKRPFVSHSKQAMFYAAVWNLAHPREDPLHRIRFVYEWKPYQAVKTFVVNLNEGYIEDMIEAAKDVTWAVRNRRVPSRPRPAVEEPEKFCKSCTYRSHCWSTNGPSNPPTPVRIIRRRRQG